MKLKELNLINKNRDFIGYRLRFQKQLLIGLSFGGSIIVGLWLLFDRFYSFQNPGELKWLRLITIIVYGINLLTALYRNTNRAFKQHLVAGFYYGTIYCMLLTMLTGATQSPYWYSLFFILIGWFVIMSLPYREMIVHGLLFIIMFLAGQFSQDTFEIQNFELAKIGFLYSGAFFIGVFAAFSKNVAEAGNFKSESEIKKSENDLKKFRLALDQAPSAVFIMDRDWNFEYINPDFERLSGYTGEELLHKNIGDTLYKNISGIPESRKGIIGSLNEGKSWKGELHTIKKDGSKYWADTIAAPWKNENGEVNGYIVIQQDVSGRKNIEKALRESEEKYRTLVENSQDGIAIVQDGQFKFVNQAMCTMLGYSPEEFYSMEGKDILPLSSRDEILKIHSKRMAGEISSLNYSMQLISKDGRLIDAETQSSTLDFEGRPAGYLTIHDVTKRNKLQEALENSELKYRQLTEMLPQTIYELDPDGNITYLNQTGLHKFGLTPPCIGVSAFSLIIPEEHEKMRINMKKSLEEDYHTPGNNYTALRSNSEKFWVMIFASPMKSEGKVTGTRGIILDMTEHEAMENALRESEEKYKSLIEKATDGIVITQNGLLKFTNIAMCDMMQYSMEELVGKSFFDFVVKEDHGLMQEYHKRRMAGEYFNSLYRSRFIRKDGNIIIVELNARTCDYNGHPAAFIIIRDITERLVIEDKLKIAKNELENLNKNLENRIRESSESLTEARTQLIRLQKENLQSQFEVLRQQVNPHFLFNSLNVLTSLIKLEPDLAEKFTEHLSKVYRYVLENKDNDLVALKTEIDFLGAYLFLLNIRFLDKIVVTINIENEKDEMLILPLALQLLIENAIKHNTMSKKTPLRISLFIDENNFLNVINNLQERESYIASTGVGLKNIEHRYELLEMPAPEFIKTETSFIAKIPLKEPGKIPVT